MERHVQKGHVGSIDGPRILEKSHLFEPIDNLLQVTEPDELRPQLLKYGITQCVHCLHYTEPVGNGMEAVVVWQFVNHQGHVSLEIWNEEAPCHCTAAGESAQHVLSS